MEHKDADGRDTDKGNQQRSTEKYCGGDYVDRSHRGGDRDEVIDSTRDIYSHGESGSGCLDDTKRLAIWKLYGNADHRKNRIPNLLFPVGGRLPEDP